MVEGIGDVKEGLEAGFGGGAGRGDGEESCVFKREGFGEVLGGVFGGSGR
jgi:hypothetical protein